MKNLDSLLQHKPLTIQNLSIKPYETSLPPPYQLSPSLPRCVFFSPSIYASMTSNSLKKIQTFHNPKILYKPTIPTQPKTKPTKMAFLVPPPSKPKPFQFPPLYRFNPLNITQNSIHLASNARFTHNSLKDRLYSQRREAKIKRARPIVCAASIPLSGDEKDSNFGRILLSDVVVVKRKRNVFWGRKWNSLDIGIVFVVAAMHLLCILAPSTFNWGAFGVAVGLYVITGLLGITLSFHRNLSHRSFKLPKWLEYLFAYCGSLALQGHPIQWVSTHRYHHQFCDSERDPHSPIEGFWFSHMSWLFDTENVAQRCGEPNNVGDLEKQPFYKFLQKTYILHHVALGALLYAMGGFPYIVWGMGVRTVWVYHITWLVNSACHVWGKQAWNTGDLSRNNWWVAVLAFGEGWHNNHHAFEYSARHGLEWWQIDMTWYAIRVLEAVGLATDVKLPTPAQKQKMAFAK